MNAAQHRLSSGLVLAAAGATTAKTPEEQLPRAAISGVGGFVCGTLPDLVEPATSPHHRQFFHSVAFAILLGYGMYRLYGWEAQTPHGKLLRALGLIAGGAYLVHLALDATTKRSLPFLGRIG